MSFTNKVVLVTGASSGIGASIAILFSKEGANVAIVGRNETKLKNIAEQCEKYGNKPLVIKADVSVDEDTKRILEETVDTFEKIDVVVNGAGFFEYGGILDGEIMKLYDSVMNTNLRAIVHLTALSAPYLKNTKGNVINISSTGSEAIPSSADFSSCTYYCVSKAALEHFTRGAAVELSSFGVRVNAIRPGPVKTDMIENSSLPFTWDMLKATTMLKRVSEPEEIAELTLFLASNKAKAVTGSVFTCDNGYLLKR